jgi:channel protein (hemolysin III family)
MDYPLYPIPGFAEPVSSLTHFFGVLLSLAMGVFLIRRGWGELGRLASLLVFVFSCVFLFSMSGTYHLLEPGTTARAVLQRLDHAAIFVLIAGTMTPPHAILYRGWQRNLILGAIWALTATFITLKMVFFESVPEWLSLGGYLSMGWLGFFTAMHLWWKYGWHAIFPYLRWVYIGAMAYTVGAVLEFLRWPTLIYGVVGPHELFHIAVLFGAGSHGFFIYKLAAGVNFPTMEERRRARLRRLQRQAKLYAARRFGRAPKTTDLP